MKTKTVITGLALAAAVSCMTGTAMAGLIPIAGDIEFTGGNNSYTTELGGAGGNLLGTKASPATTIETVTGVTVDADGTDGSYAGITGGTAVTFTVPIVYIPATPDVPFWTVTSGGDTYVFSATIMDPAQLSYVGGPGAAGTAAVNQVQLNGLGQVKEYAGAISPADLIGEGNGSWTLQLQKNGAKIQFNSGATTVPDGGLTLSLLGSALVGLVGIRSKFAKK